MWQRLLGQVRREHCVRPAPPTLPRYDSESKGPSYELSLLDHVEQEPDRAVVLFFNRPHLNEEKLRQALEATLGKFPVLAGQLKKSEDGRMYVECNDKGALFDVVSGVKAKSSVGLKSGKVPTVCYDKKLSNSCVSHVKDAATCIAEGSPLFRIKLSVFDALASDAGVCCALGLSISAVLVDWPSFYVVLQCLSQCYKRENFPDITLDRFAPVSAVLHSNIQREKSDADPIVRPLFHVEDTSAVALFLQKLGQGALPNAIFRIRADSIREGTTPNGVSSLPQPSMNELLIAEIWLALIQLREASSRVGPLSESSNDHSELAKNMPLSSLAFNLDLRSTHALPEQFWGNATVMEYCSTHTEDIALGRVSSEELAHKIAAQRCTPPTYLFETLQWLSIASQAKHTVTSTVPEGAVRVMDLMPYDWYSLKFGDTDVPVFVSLPLERTPWKVVLMPPSPREDDRICNLHVCLPALFMEILRLEWAEKLQGTVV